MVAFALRADGWYLRSDIIWAKPNPMPESVTDRPTKAHEYLFLLAKRRATTTTPTRSARSRCWSDMGAHGNLDGFERSLGPRTDGISPSGGMRARTPDGGRYG
jgi:hypothetical protein